MAIKAKTEAKAATAEADRQEEEVEDVIDTWVTSNLKFLAGRKRKKSKPRASVDQSDMKKQGNKVWLGAFEKTLIPKDELKAECEVSEMKSFKKSFEIWIKFIKEHGTEISDTRYWHILNSKMDPMMKNKLGAIEGIETAPNLFFIIGSILLLSICQYRVPM